jgi:predicted NUDIX family NTP pyrophosphohydrolase
VSFFLFQHSGGEIDQITPAMRVEVDRAHWIPIAEAAAKLSYPGEREMAGKALEILSRP